MPLACDFRQPQQQGLRLPHHQPRNHFVVKLPEQIAVARQITAVEQGNRELGIVRVVAIALGQSARCRAQLQPQVPQLLRKPPHRIFEGLLGLAIAEKKQQINVGVRKQPSSPETACSHECEAHGPVERSVPGRNDIPPQPLQNIFHQPRALRHGRSPITGRFKFPLNPRRFVAERMPQFADQWRRCHHDYYPVTPATRGRLPLCRLSDALRSRLVKSVSSCAVSGVSPQKVLSFRTASAVRYLLSLADATAPTALLRPARHCECGSPHPRVKEKSCRRRSSPCAPPPKLPARPSRPAHRAAPSPAWSSESDPHYIPARGRPRYAPSAVRGLVPRSPSCLRRQFHAARSSPRPAWSFE